MLLSIIVPVVRPELHLDQLIESFHGFTNQQVEMIIINQSGKELSNTTKEKLTFSAIYHQTSELMPAANARNLGASIANGKYLFFLDDDALVYSGAESLNELLCLLKSDVDVVIAQRGELNQGKFVSHWYNDLRKITLSNFPRYIIEWNLIIKKSLFFLLGGFPEIGPGSPHAALSGEGFVLMSKIIGANLSVLLCASLQIVHPGLFEKPRPLKVALGYSYGAGYAVGLSWFSYDLKWKVYWFFRVIGASFLDLFLRRGELMHTTIEKVNRLKYKSKLAKCRLYGFFDAITNKPPKPLAWLEHNASKMMSK